jgi:NADH:ubiquinone oxidoreductase subunit 5 (subunit L)/multisubunit Na+/H+ antiporter MnhA subunit
MQHTSSWIDVSYPIFLYTGIIFFIVHLLLYGLGLDQSYFGLALVYVGYYRVNINQWILAILWIGLVVEGFNLGKIIYERYLKPKHSVKNKREKGNNNKKKEQEKTK